MLLVLGKLAQACQVGSIATPPNRTAKAKHFCGDLQPIQLQIPGGIPDFFLTDCEFVFGTRMSHFGSKLFGGLGDLLGEFEVAWPFRLCNQAIAKSQTALSATSALIASDKAFTRSTQFLSNIRQIWSADSKLSTQTSEVRWHARAASLQKVLASGWGDPIQIPFCALGGDIQSPSHRIDFELQLQHYNSSH